MYDDDDNDDDEACHCPSSMICIKQMPRLSVQTGRAMHPPGIVSKVLFFESLMITSWPTVLSST